ncbi:ABC transporter family protein [Lactobacillus selangorensis]|uniref:ABC transporter family protein n=1 Tax=Lactobacillus selangorensis TaxID=81857 RepID=A0A0R2FLM1_9LACO|nr:ABC-F family ATP-binding cassette domain-containing protein [Lactobacillus selangorensis]KRN29448.1 ABC transporter family protein [Lactobacillus selangorensis]KRN34023.1 ABC transporter family protein [Lactobacillus selangorensis]
MQTLTATDLTKTYGEKVLLDHVSFLIREGDRIGLIGTNGTGKTTLLNILAGEEPLDSGAITKPNDYRISYLKQQPELPADLSVMDAVITGDNPAFKTIKAYENVLQQYTAHPEDQKLMDRYMKLDEQMTQQDAWNVDTDVKTILTQLHITDLNQKIGQMSGGQQKRVGLAQVLIEQPDLLIMDEPTNHLDFDSIAWLEDYLAKYKGALLVVTHDRYFLDRVSNQIFELDHGNLGIFAGNYEQYVTEKAEQVQTASEEAHKQQQLYKQELAWMHAGAKARTTKQKGRINHFNELKKNLPKKEQTQSVEIEVGQTRLGKKVIELKDVTLNLGSHPILDDFSLLVQANDRIGITGENGAGKTSLLNVIAGKLPVDSGVVSIGETVNMAYYTQMSEEMNPDQRVIQYLQEAGEEVVSKNGTHISVTQLLEQFLFPRSMHGTLIRKLSGGEKRRLYLLKLLMQQPNVLLLDEPTNDLDIGTLTILENYLQQFNGTVITVSHDRYFLDKVADKLLIFDGNAQIERFSGRLTDYLNQAAPSSASKKTTSAPKEKTAHEAPVEQKPAKKTKRTYAEDLEYKKIEPEMEQLDQTIQNLKQQMAATAGTDYTKLGDLQQQIDTLNKQLDDKMNRWDYLSQFDD